MIDDNEFPIYKEDLTMEERINLNLQSLLKKTIHGW